MRPRPGQGPRTLQWALELLGFGLLAATTIGLAVTLLRCLQVR